MFGITLGESTRSAGGRRSKRGGDQSGAYIASQDQIVYHGYDLAHGIGQVIFGRARIGEVDDSGIAQQTSGEELVVDIQRGCAQIIKVYHGEWRIRLAIITIALGINEGSRLRFIKSMYVD